MTLNTFLKFSEIIVNSQAVIRNHTERFWVLLTQFPSIITSCKIIGQYHTTRMFTLIKFSDFFLDFPHFTCIHLCWCVCRNAHNCIQICRFYHISKFVYPSQVSRYRTLLLPQRSLPLLLKPCIIFPSLILNLWQSLICSPFL